MKVRTIAASLVLVIGLAGTAAASASTSPQTTASTQAPQVRYNLVFPGLNHFFAKPQTPPLLPLLRFYMNEHTNSLPQSWRALFCLHKFRLIGKRSRRVFDCDHLGMGDLAPPGDTVTWHLGDEPYAKWYCSIGRYFVSFSSHSVSSSGIPQHTLSYSPFHKGSRISGTDWGRLPPDRRESHRQTSCKKVKGA